MRNEIERMRCLAPPLLVVLASVGCQGAETNATFPAVETQLPTATPASAKALATATKTPESTKTPVPTSTPTFEPSPTPFPTETPVLSSARETLQTQGWKLAPFEPAQSEQFFPIFQHVAEAKNDHTMYEKGGAADIHDRLTGSQFCVQAKRYANWYYNYYFNPDRNPQPGDLPDLRKPEVPLLPPYEHSSGYCDVLNGAFSLGIEDPETAVGREALVLMYSQYKYYRPANGMEGLISDLINYGKPFVILRQNREIGFQTGVVWGVHREEGLLCVTNNGRGNIKVPMYSPRDAYRVVHPDQEADYPSGTVFPVSEDPRIAAMLVFSNPNEGIINQMTQGAFN
ncbi:MAG: hypothetical protein ABIC96_04740 [Patescibacteria group bacterium]